MIDIRKLKELVRLMVSNDLTELDLRDSEEQVTLRRPSVNAPPQVVSSSAPIQNNAHGQPAAQQATSQTVAAGAGASTEGAQSGAAPPAQTDDGAKADEDLLRIESPMVGTFYTAPNPDSPPFVQVGDKVTPESVVCIVEAMKIFNEIKAECAGTIEKLLVDNGESVEFGQPLFLVRPD